MRRLALIACLLTVAITAASALIRHWQGGLDCAAWHSCAQALDRGSAAAGEPPPLIASARLAHRVSASAVGLMVALIALFGWARAGTGQRVAAALALLVTVFLAWLGRYTPHDLPLVTVGNVLGGLLLVGTLAWFAAARGAPAASGQGQGQGPGQGQEGGQRERGSAPAPGQGFEQGFEQGLEQKPGNMRDGRTRKGRAARTAGQMALIALLLLALTAFVGTMISVRGAVDACPRLACADGVSVDRQVLDVRIPGRATPLAAEGLHLVHRGLALGFSLILLAIALTLWRVPRRSTPAIAAGLLALLALQAGLGAATALGTLPLVTATLHNIVGALLVASLAALATWSNAPGRLPEALQSLEPASTASSSARSA
ncbi:MAG: COX15/CtaA family protein [Burkholderiaceae bacterium]